jgi:3-isopropylmalate dehydrogenase
MELGVSQQPSGSAIADNLHGFNLPKRSALRQPPHSRDGHAGSILSNDHATPETISVTASEHLIGLFQGEGVGPEVSQAALLVLTALERAHRGKHRFVWREGGPIGSLSISINGQPLDAEAISFCRQIFAEGGIVLAGPGGDRFVYECRKAFDLYYKLNPLRPSPLPLAARRIKPSHLEGVDILVVRDNSGGIYQGDWEMETLPSGDRLARQAFRYSESQVRSVAEVACQKALDRRGKLAIVTKPNGIPAVSQLWLECVRGIAGHKNLNVQELEIDYAAFAMIQHPKQFDVVVTSNLFGDILSDIGGLLLGSRGLCYGASFSASGAAIYQTNHGAAYDLAGLDRANPVGHLLALAMALEISFQLPEVAEMLRQAIHSVWQQGWRTEDLAESGCTTVGTQAMTECIVKAILSA